MLCEQCGTKHAEIHLVNFVNGERHVRHLCRECASEHLKVDDVTNLMKMSFSVEGLRGIEEAFKEFVVPALRAAYYRQKSSQHICPHCGGALPDSMFAHVKEEPSDEAPQAIHNDNQVMTAEEEMAELEKMMRAAVKAEDYEHAAELRDRIIVLKNSREHDLDGEHNI